jgi:glutathione synthase/RimK-type ligase-like ATP-grasp enzyme
LKPKLRVVNDSTIILWNTDKTYLRDLQDAGFLVPKTKFVNDWSTLDTAKSLAEKVRQLVKKMGDGSVVLKPSISGSSKQTHLIKNPLEMSSSDIEYLVAASQVGIDGLLIVQEYEPAISNGEYSMVFTAGEHTHTMVKTPVKGEFRCQAEYGGGIDEIGMDEVPQQAKATVKGIMRYLVSHVGAVTYCRIDGVLRENRDFILMEVEAIELHLWLETSKDPSIRDALYSALLGFKSLPEVSLLYRVWLRSCSTISRLYSLWYHALFSALRVLSIKEP